MCTDEKITTSLNNDNFFFKYTYSGLFFCRFTVHIAYTTGSKIKTPEKRNISQYH